MSPEEARIQTEKSYSLVGFNHQNQIQIVDAGSGTSLVEVPLTEAGLNPLGIAHGGLIFSICDVATGVAARTSGRKTVTQDATIYFLRPGVNTTKLTAKGRVIREGGHSGLAEAEVYTDDGTLVAKCSATIHYLT